MRIDLTLLDGDGAARDVAVIAPVGTRWGQVAELLVSSWPHAASAWIGRHRLRQDSPLGRPPLVSGAVVRATRVAPTVGGVRLQIVGGHGAGQELAVGHEPVSVGRGDGCDLVLSDARASRRHASFHDSGRGLVVRDLGSTNGTAVEGVDVVGPALVPAGAVIRIGDTFLAASHPPIAGPASRAVAATVDELSGPARGRRPEQRRVIVAPTTAGQSRMRPRAQWAATLVPAIGAGVLAVAMGSTQFLLFAALGPLAMVAGLGDDRWHWRRDRRADAAQHRLAARLFAVDAQAAVAAEVRRRRARDPDPAALLQIASGRAGGRWERHRDDPDALRVRVGLAELVSGVGVEQDGRVSPLDIRATLPACLDLRAGAIGIVGPERAREGVARSVVAALATVASPTDVEIILATAHPDRWDWVRWLPHWRGPADDRVLERVQPTAPRDRSSQLWRLFVVDAVAHPALARSLRNDTTASGVAALLLGDQADEVSCPQRIACGGETGSRARLTSADGNVLDDVVLDVISAAHADALARALAAAPQSPGAASAPPQHCRLLDLLGHDLLQAQTIRSRWQLSDGRPSTLLGLASDGAAVAVDLARDGPHLLVAGTTGSGKSELLQMLVIGLAVRHPPTELSFLLIDYKGGAAFASCTALPHTVGLVTDLDDHLTMRVLASLDSEIDRRERLLADAGARDLDAYRACVDRQNPLPRLVIVIDEFATLAEELPDFVPGLVSVAQRGRSLGLHLVLATQRPAGVVSAEIRANIALRICLRVTDAADSVDVIGSSEAASIDRRTPGRALLRSGSSTTAFQAARVGAVGEPGGQAPVRVTELDRWRRPIAAPDAAVSPDIDLLVAAVVTAASSMPRARRPWLDPLPPQLIAEDLGALAAADVAKPSDPDGHAAVSIGLVDHPEQQRRDLLRVDVGATVLVAGGARSGRTTTLRTVAHAAAAFSPARVHVHVIDAIGSELATLRSLPQVGTIACASEGFELIARLIDRLRRVVAGQRQRPRRSPALLILLDGWDQFIAESERHDGARTSELFLDLLRDAPAARATVVVTGSRAALNPRLCTHIKTKLLLRLTDLGDYALAEVERRAIPAALPGRGVRADDGAEFQIALPARADRPWPGVISRALLLRPLPLHVRLASVAAAPHELALGVGGDAARDVCIDLTRGARRLLISGPPRSGRSTALRALLAGACADAAYEPVVAAPARSPLREDARKLGVAVVGPDDEAPDLPERGLLIVDDSEAFTDTIAGDCVTAWARADRPGRAVAVAARSDLLAISFRGLAAEVRESRVGVLLQPGPVDGELLGVDLPRSRSERVPGRGVLVPDPAWGLGGAPLPIQVAQPICG